MMLRATLAAQRFQQDHRDPAHVALNRSERRAIDKRADAVFVAVPSGSPLETGERFTVPGMCYVGGQWAACPVGSETVLTAVVCR